MVTKSQLNAALDGLAKANNRAQKWRDIILQYSQDRWGCSPGDVDCDSFIDAVDGGCGMSSGMTANEFIQAMEKCIHGLKTSNDNDGPGM
jgi:hypothetical protein